jgi:hypothetical protein
MSKSEQDQKRRGKRWTLAQARQVVEQWQSSGKSGVVFAAEQGFSATRLSYWSKQIEAAASRAPKFVAVSDRRGNSDDVAQPSRDRGGRVDVARW